MAESQSTLPFGEEQSDLKGGIYAIRCKPTGKVYIGSAVVFTVRWKAHANALAANRHHSYRLQRAWNKYGPDAFAFEVIERVEPERLIEREQFHIDAFRSAVPSIGFNIRPNAASALGMVTSEETKAKLRAIPKTDEQRRAVAESNRTRAYSDETRTKHAEAFKKRIVDDEFLRKIREGQSRPETRRKLSEAHKGLVQSEETRAKRSAKLKGRTYSPETIERMREGARNRKISEEGRKALSESHKGLIQSEETKAKKSAALKGRPLSEETKEKLRAAWARRKARASAVEGETDS
jgi:group I intron endonuclease